MVIDILLVLLFIVLLLLTSTLRDILIVRMKGFFSDVILSILSGTLILLLGAIVHRTIVYR